MGQLDPDLLGLKGAAVPKQIESWRRGVQGLSTAGAGSRRGDAVRAPLPDEVGQFKVFVETKKAEDDNEDASIDAVGDETISTSTPDSVVTFLLGNSIAGDASDPGFKDLVRYRYVLTSNTDERAWLHFRMLDPTWVTD